MAKIDDQRLYVIREREYYETPRGQAVFKVTKAELDDAEKDPHGIIREESTRVLCLLRNPKAYMENILEEREVRGEPLYPQEDVRVSAPKRDEGRVVVGDVSTDLLIKDAQNGGILAPLQADDIVTRGAGMRNFLVVVKEGKFYARFGGQDEEMTLELIRKHAYRRIGTKAENPEMIYDGA